MFRAQQTFRCYAGRCFGAEGAQTLQKECFWRGWCSSVTLADVYAHVRSRSTLVNPNAQGDSNHYVCKAWEPPALEILFSSNGITRPRDNLSHTYCFGPNRFAVELIQTYKLDLITINLPVSPLSSKKPNVPASCQGLLVWKLT